MPPRSGSRYSFCYGVRDSVERWHLTERDPYRFRQLPDTRLHVVAQGDTLFELAGRYYDPLPRACGLWWVIADFQPDPVLDPTLELEVARRLYVPSLRVVTDVIFRERRGELGE